MAGLNICRRYAISFSMGECGFLTRFDALKAS